MTLDDLLVREEIKHLKARYCLHIDLKQWDEYAELFATDATMNVDTAVTTRGGDPQALPEVRGRAAIHDYIADLLAEAVTVHQCHTPVIEVTSPTTAHAIWAMEDDVEPMSWKTESGVSPPCISRAPGWMCWLGNRRPDPRRRWMWGQVEICPPSTSSVVPVT